MTLRHKMTARLPVSASLVIPVYNNENDVVSQISRCERILHASCRRYEIIIADDASRDKTPQLLKKHFGEKRNIRLLFNPVNLGIAKNLKQLYGAAKYRYIILFSADGDWRPKDIKKLLTAAYVTHADIILGSRRKYVYSPSRRIVSFLYRAIPKLFFGVDTIDPGSIKVITREVFRSIATQSTSVFFEAELIIRASGKGFRITSVPVSFIRKKHKRSGVKFNVVLQSVMDLFRLKITGNV